MLFSEDFAIDNLEVIIVVTLKGIHRKFRSESFEVIQSFITVTEVALIVYDKRAMNDFRVST